ncbi:MAG: hypothetical protein DDT38_00444 [Firmicutes bacterium]|nr:hypothetical protein [candidate division NPL-UPA2 bacterium]
MGDAFLRANKPHQLAVPMHTYAKPLLKPRGGTTAEGGITIVLGILMRGGFVAHYVHKGFNYKVGGGHVGVSNA